MSSSASSKFAGAESEGRQMMRWSLRFTDPTIEATFLASRTGKLFWNIGWVSLLCAGVGCVNMTQHILSWHFSEVSGGDKGREVDWSSTIHLSILIVQGLTVFALARLPSFQQGLKSRGAEGLVALLMVTIGPLGTMMDLVVHGGWPPGDNPLYTAAGTLIYLDVVITVAHLALPARWFILFWVDMVFLFCATLYICMLHFIPIGEIMFLVSMFTGLIIGTLVGLRSYEVSERSLFITIVDERTMRMQAEFSRELSSRGLSPRRGRRGAEGDEGGCKRCAGDEKIDISSGAASDPGQGGAGGRAHRPTGRRSWAGSGGLGVGEDDLDRTQGSIRSVASTTYTGKVFQEVNTQFVFQTDNALAALAHLRDLGEQEHWLIRQRDLTISPEVIGHGGQADVLLGTYCRLPVAVKVHRGPTRSGLAAINELRILRHVHHPNIALLHGAYMGSPERGIILVLELVNGRPLDEFLSMEQTQMPAAEHVRARTEILQGVCYALIYLHSRKPCIVHADLKPKNVLIEKREMGPFPKLLDFGLSRTVTRHSRLSGGTKLYVAPEVVVLKGRPSAAADIYSLGRLMMCISTGQKPPRVHLDTMTEGGSSKAGTESAHLRKASNDKAIGSKDVPDDKKSRDEHTPKRGGWTRSPLLMSQWQASIEECTRYDPLTRPSAEEVYCNNFREDPLNPEMTMSL